MLSSTAETAIWFLDPAEIEGRGTPDVLLKQVLGRILNNPKFKFLVVNVALGLLLIP